MLCVVENTAKIELLRGEGQVGEVDLGGQGDIVALGVVLEAHGELGADVVRHAVAAVGSVELNVDNS